MSASASRSPRMSDVAALAGVSLGTVSHVLNHPEKVAHRTLARVNEAIAALGFVPDRRAQALAGGTSNTIGFVIIDLSNSLFLDMARGAEAQAQEAGKTVLLGNSDMQREKERIYLALFEEERVAGTLIAPRFQDAGDLVAAGPWTRHLVVLNTCPGPERCCVTTDEEMGGYLAARHLIETGRRRLVFAGATAFAPVHQRHLGAQRAVRETNGAVRLTLMGTRGLRPAHGRDVGARIAALPRAERPDGVVAAADLLGVGIVESVLSGTDLRFGRDISLVGYDNNQASWDSLVPLSTMAQPGEEMGRLATALLLEEIEETPGHVHQHVVLEPRLIIRDSSQR